ncbi:HAD-superfamily subfamily IIA hydrolase [Coniosporium apollinis CBS 100218]|uniref:HAD-superfamily subfamily IIA hydrolase n=1 Tax=Coniosporium apollinis (strain CBS 100218) TaxID=1168221 RepID=R7Z0V8_CONA1|nr:HAD-superfamily subfamily IIA hydrolase [Coniosporium apollinis CBS 100218]EON67713.1 HAD-superfamily subfamily IIA hydrolase [Coniosporium apollinis CBS 100218]
MTSISPFVSSSRQTLRAIPRCSRARASIACKAATLPYHRCLQTSAPPPQRIPDFAFAFDIDGVLLRSHDPLPRARKALSYLQQQRIPSILLTNGGGKHESERVADLSESLGVSLDTSMFVQSHTPFADMDQYKNKTVLVCGGEGDKCRVVAEKYGYRSVVTPGDILVQHPEVWPFSAHLTSLYKPFARPLPRPIHPTDPSSSLKIDAIFIYNDPRDWGLDATLILDLLLSSRGILGTLSASNNTPSFPNRGYQQDAQPPLYFSNPDLWWAAKYHLPRLGQGGFREALEGLWAAVTGGERMGVRLMKTVIGKPFRETFEFAEKKLVGCREEIFREVVGEGRLEPLRRVYMVGDNPESDIRGGNTYQSPHGTDWCSILVKTGVYQEGQEPTWKPRVIVEDVYDAVQWAVEQSEWDNGD